MPQETNIIDLRIITKMGAVYKFPDVEQSALESLCPFMQDGVPSGVNGQLSLINASVAVLSVPLRILAEIQTCPSAERCGEWKTWWKAPPREDECYPASTAKSP